MNKKYNVGLDIHEEWFYGTILTKQGELITVCERIDPYPAANGDPHLMLTLSTLNSVPEPKDAQRLAVPGPTAPDLDSPQQRAFLLVTDADGAIIFSNTLFRQAFIDPERNHTQRHFLDFCDKWLLSNLEKTSNGFRELINKKTSIETTFQGDIGKSGQFNG